MKYKGLRVLCFAAVFLTAEPFHAQSEPSVLTNAFTAPAPGDGIWENGVGAGFWREVASFNVSVGASYGLQDFGSREKHDLAIISLTYGHMLSRVWGDGHWWRGNVEFRAELFTGAQFSPNSEWFVGLTPHLRYDLATGTRWVPYIDAGAGVTATGIGQPDLSGTFEFNLQAGLGLHYFVTPDLALTLDVRYLHWSCAGMSAPNLGLNGFGGMLGVSFFF